MYGGLVKHPSHKLDMREKLRHFGAENLTPQELLALVLGSGNGVESVKKTASRILKAMPLETLAHKPLSALLSVSGLGMAKAARILAALELGRRSAQPPKRVIKNPAAALPYLAEMRSKTREHTLCLYLNARHELVHKETIAVGGLNYSVLEARDVFAPAFRLPATSIILAHNHPSGTLEASEDDLHVTEKLVEAGKLLGITLLDHLILTHQGHISLKEKGYIP